MAAGVLGVGVGSPSGGATTTTAAGTLDSRGAGVETDATACSVSSEGGTVAEIGAITGGASVTVTVTVTGGVASVADGGVVAVTVTGDAVVVEEFMDSWCLGWS